jgi:hypothetical protein
MRGQLKIILIHALLWIVLSVLFFFASEFITVQLFEGFHSVELWLLVLGAGLILIFLAITFSLVVKLIRLRKKRSSQ